MGHKIKQVAAVGLKAGPGDGLDEGTFVAYAATFTRTPDSYGDVIAKGAFVKSIADWKASGDVMPIMYMHDPNQIIGGVLDMGEDDHGWWIKGQLDEDPASQKIYRLLKGRRLSALSFAYDVVEDAQVTLDGDRKATELRELRVHEASLLPKGFAANSDTSVVAVKNSDGMTALLERVEDLSARVDALTEVSAPSGADVVSGDEASAAGHDSDEDPTVGKSDEGGSLASVDSLAVYEAELEVLGAMNGGHHGNP